MIEFRGRGVVLDIEGTTSSISFVYDVMFPFVRRELNEFLATHWGDPQLAEACAQIARDAGAEFWHAWCPLSDPVACQRQLQAEVLRLMDADVKATGLKALQGLIWEAGFDSGELVAHVYDDVLPALRAWRGHGIDIRVYSSGSVTAQRLFFGHTKHGDLLPLFSAHYDTTIGSKKDVHSYQRIAADIGHRALELLFVSDVVEELNAAREAGFVTALCRRPGNPHVADTQGHAAIDSFAEIIVGQPPFT